MRAEQLISYAVGLRSNMLASGTRKTADLQYPLGRRRPLQGRALRGGRLGADAGRPRKLNADPDHSR
jgi:hypothetical protein